MFTMFAMPQPARALQTGPQELALASLCAVIPSRCHSHGMGPPALRLPLPSLFSPLWKVPPHTDPEVCLTLSPKHLQSGQIEKSALPIIPSRQGDAEGT